MRERGNEGRGREEIQDERRRKEREKMKEEIHENKDERELTYCSIAE